LTSGHCVKIDASGNFIDAGSACASSSGPTLLTTLTASNSSSLSACDTGCTQTVTIDSTYSFYVLEFSNVLPASNNVQCQITVKSGGAFKVTNYHSNGVGNGTSSGDISTYIPCSDGSSGVGNSGNGAGVTGKVTFSNPTGTFPTFYGLVSYLNNNTTSRSATTGGVWWNGGTGGAINGVSIAFGAGNISSGSINLYGYP
jgi:hypothetical protein